ncbi:MAG: FG-GAP-like repeat-containing protein, partial [Chloroflexota bacterium]
MKKLWMLLSIVFLVMATATAGLASPLSQDAGQEYVVQDDDWLSKIAEKFYGDLLTFPVIVDATNAKAEEDDTFTLIEDPNLIEVGQKLWIPDADAAAEVLTELIETGAVSVAPATTSQTVDQISLLKKISNSEGFFSSASEESSLATVTSLGDLDGDGVTDLAVGVPANSPNADPNNSTGVVWVLFMNADGSVKLQQQTAQTINIETASGFGDALASADLNGDGQMELLVGESFRDDGGENRGSMWVLFLNTDGTVSSSQQISHFAGGMEGILNDGDTFGAPIANMGDVTST